VFYWALFVGGVQEAKPVVGTPDPGTVADASGLKRGETILKINDEPMASWQQVRWRLLQLAVEKTTGAPRSDRPQNSGSPGVPWICRISTSKASTAILWRVWV